MRKLLVLLSPILIGILVILGAVLVAPDSLRFAESLLLLGLVSTTITIVVLYAGALAHNSLRLATRKKVEVSKLLLFLPVVAGILLTLSTGVVVDPFGTDSGPDELPQPEDHFTFYGYPLYWRSLPIQSCQENSQRFFPPLQCQQVVHWDFLTYDVLFYAAGFLLVYYALVLFLNIVPFLKTEKWPFFLPKPSEK